MGRRFLRATSDLGRLQQRLIRRLTYAGLVVLALGAASMILAVLLDLGTVFDALGRGAVGAAGVAGGIVVLPWVCGLAPLYAAIGWGEWAPLVFSLAGPSLLALLAALARPGIRQDGR